MADRPTTLVLASGSPRRRHLLESAGLEFAVRPAGVDEHEALDGRSPPDYVMANARLKAEHVSAARPDCLVLGADTTVFLDNEILNKPADLEDAHRMIRRLSGRAHTVFTGYALRWSVGEVRVDRAVSSRVVFRALSDDAIAAYFKIVNPLDKAGAYGIQQGRERIIDHFEGSFSNIMGLPMEDLEATLANLNLLDLFRKSTV